MKPFLPESNISSANVIITTKPLIIPSSTPKIIGLTNLGNTCFFNAVMQNLAQTPFLIDVLQDMAEPGEKFTLPGGKVTIDGEEEELETVSGELAAWGSLSQSLHYTLSVMTSNAGSYFTPNKLFSQLTSKMPQFGGGDQHDSHELLRHLLEAVRSEDLRRYQTVILKNLGLGRAADPQTVESDVKQKVKFYGNQATERIMRPEQVFRGFLVSTLTCQECRHTSSRHEYFLDISLPVSMDKPQPPRRRSSPEPTYQLLNNKDNEREGPSKHQLKKEKKNARKGRKQKQRNSINNDNTNDSAISEEMNSFGQSSSDQSDADVEDNVDETKISSANSPLAEDANGNSKINTESGYNSEKLINSDSIRTSPDLCNTNNKDNVNGSFELSGEMHGDSPKSVSNLDSGVASPIANIDINSSCNIAIKGHIAKEEYRNAEDDGNACNMDQPKNDVVEIGLSLEGRVNMLNDKSKTTSKNNSPVSTSEDDNPFTKVVNKLEKFAINDMEKEDLSCLGAVGLSKTVKQEANKLTQEKSKESKLNGWNNTLAPRYNCEDMECSIQSCLNQFTALELMTGNNKVCCDACTETINGKGGKTINTNATKQFLISNPPAVLILHLKRFQVGPRFMFRKMSKHVTFPFILDIAPFCGAKVRDLPNVSRTQKKLLYSLYGVVEHSGGMRGGHYVAYVKSRTPITKNDVRWEFLPKGHKAEEDDETELKAQAEMLINDARSSNGKPDDDSSLSGYESEEEATGKTNTDEEVSPLPGKWYYISDSHVREISEEKVLDTQAYLLFYERIL